MLTNFLERRTVRAPVNPLDKATVVSIYPQEVNEVKHTILPGRFHIDAGSYEKPTILVVGPSSWWREVDENQPLLEITVSSIQVADSIVNDYCNGLLACDMGENRPGLFYLPGDIPLQILNSQHRVLLDKAKVRQDNWYRTLVKMADVMWARTNGNPLSVSDQSRMAAKQLGIDKDKDWMKGSAEAEMVRCIACGTFINSAIIVCPNCHVVLNKKQFEELGLKFAS